MHTPTWRLLPIWVYRSYMFYHTCISRVLVEIHRISKSYTLQSRRTSVTAELATGACVCRPAMARTRCLQGRVDAPLLPLNYAERVATPLFCQLQKRQRMGILSTLLSCKLLCSVCQPTTNILYQNSIEDSCLYRGRIVSGLFHISMKPLPNVRNEQTMDGRRSGRAHS
jgi:hypothetical protein